MASAMITVNGIALPRVSEYEWDLQDVSAGESGRTQDAIMHKNTVAKKRKLKLSWNYLSFEEACSIIQTVSASEYMTVTYPDYLSGNRNESRTFYVGDRHIPVKYYNPDDPDWQKTEKITFDLIER